MHVMEFSKRKTAVQFAKLADHAIARDGIEWDGRKEGRKGECVVDQPIFCKATKRKGNSSLGRRARSA